MRTRSSGAVFVAAVMTMIVAFAAGATGCAESGDPGSSDRTVPGPVASEAGPEPSGSSTLPEPKEATQGPAAGFTLALSFEPLVNGFWIPIEVDGHVYEPGRCEHWEFGERDGVPTISGFDGCNWFQTSHRGSEQALSLDNGRLTNVGWYITLVGCPNVGVSPLPEEGMQFWIDESGDRLIVTTDSTEAQLQFDRQEETPRCTR